MKTSAKNFIILGVLSFFVFSCVSKEKYVVLSYRAKELRNGNTELKKEKLKLSKSKKKLNADYSAKAKYIKSKSFELKKFLYGLGLDCKVKEEDLKKLKLDVNYALREEEYQPSAPDKVTLDVAKKTKWLSKDEKDIYYYLNYARVYPIEFCNDYVLPLYKKDPGNVYLATLVEHLYKMNPVEPVVPDRQLFDEAKCHAVSGGEQGAVSHDRVSSQCSTTFSGECISYGESNAVGHIVRLLIDQGTESLGHRYICLEEGYKTCGIAIAPHTVYTDNVVLDFH